VNHTIHPEKRSWSRIALLGALILLAWTFFGVLASFQMFVNTDDDRRAFPLSLVLHLAVGNNLLKGLISLPLIWVFYRVPIPLSDWKRRSILYFVLLPAFVIIHGAVRPFVLPFVTDVPLPEGTNVTFVFMFFATLRSFFVDNAWGFFSVVLGFHLWQYARQARERTLNEGKLEARLASAELQVLKMQLQPHFLFNTLNTIYNLIPVNGREAQAMISRLSNLLRFSLDHVTTEKVTLQHELNFLMQYIGIEKVRFEERLRVEQDVAANALHGEVPNMILQPVVENAIRHGIGNKAGGGTIKIAARRVEDRLLITVTDDGTNPVRVKNGSGIGLANTRARLTKLYGQDFTFGLEPFGPGAQIRLEIPFEEQTPAHITGHDETVFTVK
jgi:two-component system, LytTR family, sensor kinase